ncbi:hypothetical protein ZIOFF_013116 [Zingiber officinale]|uniref:Uncharacterized protein n=1 Tax=Zingiber officinale TaxID=94328 RepID=A0A8J5LNQ7_ZINOF|nr:hypothetical protein ZIOFF_013116 [Zingiber officinale]
MEEEEEFAEADVLWPEPDHPDAGEDDGCEMLARPFDCRKPVSRPIRIPAPRAAPPRHRQIAPWVELGGDDVSCGNGESVECGVPPHVMVRRRGAAFTGREKGRRLCDLRDAVLRLTGFIEG